jgi:hypothetical protein
MNLIGAIVVNLWVAGWMIAAVRAGLKARDVNPDRYYPTVIRMKSGSSGR